MSKSRERILTRVAQLRAAAVLVPGTAPLVTLFNVNQLSAPSDSGAKDTRLVEIAALAIAALEVEEEATSEVTASGAVIPDTPYTVGENEKPIVHESKQLRRGKK